MRSRKNIVLLTIIGLSVALTASAQVDREKELQSLAKNFVPEGMRLAHEIVQGSLVTSPATSSEKIVVLYRIAGYAIRRI